MIEIDGSFGHGGGQIFRTSIALSVITNKPVKITNIRAKRENPGLARQHLTALKALAKISSADVKGDKLGSTAVMFSPGGIEPGEYKFDVGTAGSVTLVLQCLLLACAKTEKEIKFEIKGGTNTAWSPPVDYLQHVTLPMLQKMGYAAKIELLQRGFYPKGGGLVNVTVHPSELKPVRFEKFEPKKIEGIVFTANLPEHVADRMKKAALKELIDYNVSIKKVVETAFSTGAGIVLWAVNNSILGGDCLGERGKPAEQVGKEGAKNLLKEIEAGATVDRYMADQILPYMALAGGGRFRTSEITGHTKTNLEIIKKFISIRFDVSDNWVEAR